MNNIKRYGRTFVITIFILILLLLMEKAIPNTKSRINIAKSENYIQELYKNNQKPQDIKKELSQLSIIYLENNKNYYSEMIEMNIDSKALNKYRIKKTLKSYDQNSNYSRYWNGNIVFLKPLLTFFTYNIIYIIYFAGFLLLTCLLLFKLFKHSKLLTIVLLISSLLLNIISITKYTNMMIMIIVSLFTSIILLNMYEKKNKNIDILFLITGMLTSFFNLGSCGTLSLTIPLFIYLYISFKEKKDIKLKEIIKLVILWLFGFFITTIIKWILVAIHYNGISKMANPNKVTDNFLTIINNFWGNPLSYIVFILAFISIIVSILLPIIDKNNKKYYIPLIGISIIPFIRLLFVVDNFIILLPLIMLWILLDIRIISVLKNKKVTN